MIDRAKAVVSRVRAAAGGLAGFIADGQVRRFVAFGLGRRIAANAWPILISIAIATGVYMKIHERPNEEFVRNVAVRPRGAPEGSSIRVDPPTIRVTFRGSRQEMLGLDMVPANVEVAYPSDTNRLTEAGATVKVSKKNVRFSAMRGFGTATVVDVDPKSVRIREDKPESRGFDIEPPKLEGSPHRGYRAEVVDYSPKRVVVTGGVSILKAWEELGKQLQLPPVSVDGRVADFSKNVKILPPNGEDAIGVDLPDTIVKVDVRIVRPRDSSTIDDIPVRLAFPQGFSFPETVEVEPATVRMTLVGVEEQLREVGSANVAVYAEIGTNAIPVSAGAETNAVEVALVACIPHDKSISEVNLNPPTVRIFALAPEEGWESQENLGSLEPLEPLENLDNPEPLANPENPGNRETPIP